MVLYLKSKENTQESRYIMTRPLIPVNPEGLDAIAEELLAGTPSSENPPLPAQGVSDPERDIILPGKTHGTYSYPDLLVGMERAHLGTNWGEAHAALHQEGAFMLTVRQYVDFLGLLKSGNVYNGCLLYTSPSPRD